MTPSVYLYKEGLNEVELYLGEFSTIQGLSLFNPDTGFELSNFGATCYKDLGWATVNDMPSFKTVGDIVTFLKCEDDIGIVEFESVISGVGSFNTHDDGECHFKLKSKHLALSILRKVVPDKERDVLINYLLNNQNFYITCDDFGGLNKFGSFDDYLGKSA
jgi:hypothetical protein